jgi:replication factor C subunit 3/5
VLGAGGCRALSRALARARRLTARAPARPQLNASDDRGIDVVREQIKSFAGTRKLFSSGVKLVILDEADAMTNDAQFALRRVIEKYTRTTRFCLLCNYVSKIIPALQSRCTRFRFAPLQPAHVLARFRHVVDAEGLAGRLRPDGETAILRQSGGDMRKVLNVLQACAAGHAVVDEAAVYACTGTPAPWASRNCSGPVSPVISTAGRPGCRARNDCSTFRPSSPASRRMSLSSTSRV